MENGEWFSLETEAEWKITAWEGVVSIAQFSTAALEFVDVLSTRAW